MNVQSFIDGSQFVDVDTRLYYLYSGAGNLNIQEVDAATGTQKIGEPTVIWQATNPDPDDNAGVTEAPFLVYADDQYFLFYSTGTYSQPDYTVTYATSPFILGPYTEQGDLLATGAVTDGGAQLSGPGGATLVPVNDGSGNFFMVSPAVGSIFVEVDTDELLRHSMLLAIRILSADRFTLQQSPLLMARQPFSRILNSLM